jgi:hypothetical protein
VDIKIVSYKGYCRNKVTVKRTFSDEKKQMVEREEGENKVTERKRVERKRNRDKGLGKVMESDGKG